jgi:hypothetical protein
MPGIHRLIELVDETSAWLRSIGLDPEPTRFGVYDGLPPLPVRLRGHEEPNLVI